jgi:hypothetical protein
VRVDFPSLKKGTRALSDFFRFFCALTIQKKKGRVAADATMPDLNPDIPRDG